MSRGVPQGALISPLLFNLFFEYATSQTSRLSQQLDCFISKYADDVLFVSKHYKDLKELTDCFLDEIK